MFNTVFRNQALYTILAAPLFAALQGDLQSSGDPQLAMSLTLQHQEPFNFLPCRSSLLLLHVHRFTSNASIMVLLTLWSHIWGFHDGRDRGPHKGHQANHQGLALSLPASDCG